LEAACQVVRVGRVPADSGLRQLAGRLRTSRRPPIHHHLVAPKDVSPFRAIDQKLINHRTFFNVMTASLR